MKENGVGVSRFVRVVLVEEFTTGMVRIREFIQLGTQAFDLSVIEKPNTGHPIDP